MKRPCMVFIGLFVLFSFGMVPAASEKDYKFNVGDSIDEILNSINEIIESNIRLTEAKLLGLRRAFREKENAAQQQAKDAIEKKLKEMLADLKNMQKTIKKELKEKENLPKEKLDQYSKKLDQLEERIEELGRKAKSFAEDIEKECRLLKNSISQSIRDIIAEMERIINRMEEGLKRQKQVDQQAISI